MVGDSSKIFPATMTGRIQDRDLVLFVIAVSMLALTILLVPVAKADFPINDGGLFYRMTLDLQAARYRLPEFTSYNNADIPYAYPPLGFYLTGALSELFKFSLLDLFQYLPLLITILTIPAFYFLAKRLLPSALHVGFSVLAYAFTPALFSWNMMGGGLTRSLGLLFCLLALISLYDLYTHCKYSRVFPVVAFTSLTILSHPISAFDLLLGGALLFLFWGRRKRCVYLSVLSIALIVLVTSPWWVTVLSQGGIRPYWTALSSGGQSLSSLILLINFDFTEEVISNQSLLLASWVLYLMLQKGTGSCLSGWLRELYFNCEVYMDLLPSQSDCYLASEWWMSF